MYLRWNTLQKSPNLCDDLTNRRSDRLIYCRRGNHTFSRQTAHTVNTDDFSRILRIFFQICKRYFQSSGCTFADRKIKLSADRCQDILCQTVTAYGYHLTDDHTGICNNRNLCCSCSNVYDHGSLGTHDRNTKRQCICNRTFHQKYLTLSELSGMGDTVICTLFYLCHIYRNSKINHRVPPNAASGLVQQRLKHDLQVTDVCDHTIEHRRRYLYIGRILFVYFICFISNGKYSIFVANGNHIFLF